MNFFSAITALGSAGPLASRAFLPLFIVSLLAAYPQYCADLLNYTIVMPDFLAWMTSQECLTVLGILAFLECLADKNNEIKEFLDQIEHGIKAAVAVLVALAVIPPEVEQVVNTMEAGYSGRVMFALMVGVTTFYMSSLRTRFFNWLREADPDDSLGIRTVISWLEDGWGVLGMGLLLILSPILVTILVGCMFGVAFMAMAVMNRLERRGMYPCPSCETSVMPTAVACKSCGEQLIPHRVLAWTPFSTIKNNVQPLRGDLRFDHQLRLLSLHKCPSCAERVRAREFIANGCPSCQYRFTEDIQSQWFEDYQERVLKRARAFFVPVFFAGAIPVVGFSVAIVVIKLCLVSPLMVFLNMRQRFGLRWGMRLLTLLLLIPSCMPFVSLVTVPLLLMLHVWVYGQAARRNVALPSLDAAVLATNK